MKVLIVSHNPFCASNNMGKTLCSYFGGFEKCDLAQLYIHTNSPDFTVCENYYRVTDSDMLRSVLTRKSGTVITSPTPTASVTVTDGKRRIYNKGRSRTPAVYLARNLLWRLGAWKTRRLREWVDAFAPDVVFFAAGDYAFMYDVARYIAEYRGIPLAVACVDDFYFFNRNEGRFLGRAVHRSFLRTVRKTMNYASLIYTICDKMAADYKTLFDRPTTVLHTASSIAEPIHSEKSGEISYIGNLGLGRDRQLIALGKALAKLDTPNSPRYITVYSGETREEILAGMTKENGIDFRGSIPPESVPEVMGSSIALIHTESFDPHTTKIVEYSVSTKIADSLASGTPLIAFGPSGVASMRYLADNGAAFMITEGDDPATRLGEFLADESAHARITARATALARENHSTTKIHSVVKNGLTAIHLAHREG